MFYKELTLIHNIANISVFINLLLVLLIFAMKKEKRDLIKNFMRTNEDLAKLNIDMFKRFIDSKKLKNESKCDSGDNEND
jgi:hypothetical protein